MINVIGIDQYHLGIFPMQATKCGARKRGAGKRGAGKRGRCPGREMILYVNRPVDDCWSNRPTIGPGTIDRVRLTQTGARHECPRNLVATATAIG